MRSTKDLLANTEWMTDLVLSRLKAHSWEDTELDPFNLCGYQVGNNFSEKPFYTTTVYFVDELGDLVQHFPWGPDTVSFKRMRWDS